MSFSVQDISNDLGISKATFANWKKLGIIPDFRQTDDEKVYSEFLLQIKQNAKEKLTSRANRSFSNQRAFCFLGIKENEEIY